jgi:PIN domain nuclease of toxin-antitoxin system
VRVLLDSHALLWYVLGDSKLSSTAEGLIRAPENEVLLSPASYWEIAIKVSNGKYSLSQPLEDLIHLCLIRYGFRILPIEPQHAARLITLPVFKDHKDPFDRLLIAQALTEEVPIVSADSQFDAYGVTRLW